MDGRKAGPENAGYDQPGDPPAYSAQMGGQIPHQQQPQTTPQMTPPQYPQPSNMPPPHYGQPYMPPQQYPPQPQQYPMTTNFTNVVVAQNTAPTVVLAPPRMTDYTVSAILATIFCFFPTGICAIIAAVHARAAHNDGDYEGERSSTAWARGLTITSVVIGSSFSILMFILYFVLFSESAVSHTYK